MSTFNHWESLELPLGTYYLPTTCQPTLLPLFSSSPCVHTIPPTYHSTSPFRTPHCPSQSNSQSQAQPTSRILNHISSPCLSISKGNAHRLNDSDNTLLSHLGCCCYLKTHTLIRSSNPGLCLKGGASAIALSLQKPSFSSDQNCIFRD